MLEAGQQKQKSEELRERLSKLSDASLRITASLDLNTTLQAVVDGACTLTDARYGALLVFDDSGQVQEFVTCGITAEQTRRVGSWPKAIGLLGHLRDIHRPLRLSDIADHPTSVGFPENHPQMKTFLGMPICHKGELLGSIYLTEKVDGQEFTLDDENTIDMFASQAAIAISNALKYRAEQRAKSDLQALLNSSPMGVFVLDAKTGDVLSLNEETKRMVGGVSGQGDSLEHLLSVMTFRRADGREICLAESPLAQVLRSGETVRAEEIVIYLPNGQSVTTLVNARPIYSDEGDIVSVVVTVQDMTPLQEVERLRAEFLGMVNDELLTPLTTIKGSTATVLGSPCPLDPAETQQFFRIINEQTDQIRDLINNLLDATRIEAGTFSINSEPTDLAGIVLEARNAFLSGEAKNDVITDLPPDLPRVMADRQRIMKAMNTLFSNASKNSPEESTIRVTASQVDAHVAVTVTDEGRGVSTERLPHLFRKFSWADGDEGRCQIERAGLDLAVCKGIVEAHGGEISAESAGPELGTRVTFTIPVASEDEKVAAAISPQLPARVEQTDSEQERILAVDEDPQILRYVRDTLSGGGYFPITTGNLDEVIRQIYDHKPSLVLLDLVLAGSNEFEIVKSISQITDAPIIFLSGYGRDQIISEAFDLGAADYIVKPFSPTELMARISAALYRKAVYGRSQALDPYLQGDLKINYAERGVTVAGRPVYLTATEYKLLFELSINSGRVLTHDQLLERVWGGKASGNSQVLRAFVKVLRRKLGDDVSNPRFIFTEHRVGYRMAKPE